jgi:phosphoribosyl-ATP pyrophosphohydrolase
VATPRRIFRIYHRLGRDAETVREFQVAQGEKVSSTVSALIARDRARLLARWGEEMAELCGVLDGTHDDSYLMEATQCWYWASLYAVAGGADWDSIAFDAGRRLAATCGIETIPELRAATQRLVEVGADKAKPEKLFLLWCVADRLYRAKTDAEDQWSIEQLMEADLQDMKKRAYLAPILREILD